MYVDHTSTAILIFLLQKTQHKAAKESASVWSFNNYILTSITPNQHDIKFACFLFYFDMKTKQEIILEGIIKA